jgi:hypothetical protein
MTGTADRDAVALYYLSELERISDHTRDTYTCTLGGGCDTCPALMYDARKRRMVGCVFLNLQKALSRRKTR